MVALKSPPTQEQHSADMADYIETGCSRARPRQPGTIVADDEGKLDPAIRGAVLDLENVTAINLFMDLLSP